MYSSLVVLSVFLNVVLSTQIEGPRKTTPAQTARLCGAIPSVCFTQFTDPGTGATLGLALPATSRGLPDPFAQDFLANFSVPLPYGFAGFSGITGTTRSSISQFSVNVVMTLALDKAITPLNALGQVIKDDEVLLAQFSTQTANQSALVPTTEKIATVTLSNLSFYTPNRGSFVFRCQNCSILAGATGSTASCTSKSHSHVSLNLFSSHSAVRYLSDTAHSAAFPLTSNLTLSTVHLDIAGLMVPSKEYTTMLKAAGVA